MYVRKLYYQLLRIRMVEERIVEEYPKQEMRCPVHLCIGQEAIAVGVCGNLTKNDVVFSGHRSHGHFLAKGGDMKRMIAEIYGKETGCCLGRGGSQHLIDFSVNFLGSVPIVAETIPIAVGSALASILKNDKQITVTFFGEAAVEEGVTHESINFAVLKKLPVLFVCENNFYSTYSPLSVRQPKREIYKLIKGHGLPAFQEDGNDVLKVYKLAKKSVDYVKSGKGPVFLEFITYRHREHVGPNFDPPGFRKEGELKKWIKKDPLKMIIPMRNEIANGITIRTLHPDVTSGLSYDRYKKAQIGPMREKIRKEIDEAFEFAKKSPYPEELSERQVYAK